VQVERLRAALVAVTKHGDALTGERHGIDVLISE
jgi:hypothetical protein